MALDGLEIAALAMQVIASLIYLSVARFLAKRNVSEEARGAQRGFVFWWAGLGLLGLYGLVFNNNYGINIAEQGLVFTLTILYLLIGGLFVIIAGLMYYLLYLYTGKKAALRWIAVFWVFMVVFLVWLIHGTGGGPCIYSPGDADCTPSASWEEGDGATLGSASERPAVLGGIFGLLLVTPILGSALAYALLFFRVDGATAKYRVAAISLGIILWMGFSTLSNLFALAGGADARPDFMPLIGQGLGIFSGSLVYLAYYPPKWAQSMWGVGSLRDEATSQ